MTLRSIRNRHLLLLDALLLALAPFALYVLRLETFALPDGHLHTAIRFVAIAIPLQIAIFAAFGAYSGIWRYASIAEVRAIFTAGVISGTVSWVLGRSVLSDLGVTPSTVPLSVLFTDALLAIAIIAAPRLLLRIRVWPSLQQHVPNSGQRRVMIAGAGAAGQLIARELRENPALKLTPVAFVDDDPTKHGLRLSGLPVLGSLDDLKSIARAHRIDEVIVGMPSAPGTVVRQVLRGAIDAGIKARTMPGLSDILSGRVNVSALREIEIDDLLRREPIRTDLGRVRAMATGRTVLVTGAGGSIGSELARQIAQLEPARLVLLDHAENPIFYILNELRVSHPTLTLVPVIADVRDRRRIVQTFEQWRPHAVFHAAAHKHVPLMEENVYEAVTNNVQGTQNVVSAAAKVAVKHFVFISTDKAVRPTSIMGASKRIAEHVVRHTAMRHKTNYVAVRFGNVLGSQGSVVPTFLSQIKAGGPVTVTHPEMRRYFMTIPEAVQLVLQAATLGRGGELFMLDMGEPVKIVDLAKDLIRLCGLEEGADIAIEFTGMRPGEKLYEEMFFDHETASRTEHPKVLCARDAVEPWEMEMIDELVRLSRNGATDDELRMRIKAIVPDFSGCDQPTIKTPPFGLLIDSPAEPRAAAGDD